MIALAYTTQVNSQPSRVVLLTTKWTEKSRKATAVSLGGENTVKTHI